MAMINQKLDSETRAQILSAFEKMNAKIDLLEDFKEIIN